MVEVGDIICVQKVVKIAHHKHVGQTGIVTRKTKNGYVYIRVGNAQEFALRDSVGVFRVLGPEPGSQPDTSDTSEADPSSDIEVVPADSPRVSVQFDHSLLRSLHNTRPSKRYSGNLGCANIILELENLLKEDLPPACAVLKMTHMHCCDSPLVFVQDLKYVRLRGTVDGLRLFGNAMAVWSGLKDDAERKRSKLRSGGCLPVFCCSKGRANDTDAVALRSLCSHACGRSVVLVVSEVDCPHYWAKVKADARSSVVIAALSRHDAGIGYSRSVCQNLASGRFIVEEVSEGGSAVKDALERVGRRGPVKSLIRLVLSLSSKLNKTEPSDEFDVRGIPFHMLDDNVQFKGACGCDGEWDMELKPGKWDQRTSSTVDIQNVHVALDLVERVAATSVNFVDTSVKRERSGHKNRLVGILGLAENGEAPSQRKDVFMDDRAEVNLSVYKAVLVNAPELAARNVDYLAGMSWPEDIAFNLLVAHVGLGIEKLRFPLRYRKAGAQGRGNPDKSPPYTVEDLLDPWRVRAAVACPLLDHELDLVHEVIAWTRKWRLKRGAAAGTEADAAMLVRELLATNLAKDRTRPEWQASETALKAANLQIVSRLFVDYDTIQFGNIKERIDKIYEMFDLPHRARALLEPFKDILDVIYDDVKVAVQRNIDVFRFFLKEKEEADQ